MHWPCLFFPSLVFIKPSSSFHFGIQLYLSFFFYCLWKSLIAYSTLCWLSLVSTLHGCNLIYTVVVMSWASLRLLFQLHLFYMNTQLSWVSSTGSTYQVNNWMVDLGMVDRSKKKNLYIEPAGLYTALVSKSSIRWPDVPKGYCSSWQKILRFSFLFSFHQFKTIAELKDFGSNNKPRSISRLNG